MKRLKNYRRVRRMIEDVMAELGCNARHACRLLREAKSKEKRGLPLIQNRREAIPKDINNIEMPICAGEIAA